MFEVRPLVILDLFDFCVVDQTAWSLPRSPALPGTGGNSHPCPKHVSLPTPQTPQSLQTPYGLGVGASDQNLHPEATGSWFGLLSSDSSTSYAKACSAVLMMLPDPLRLWGHTSPSTHLILKEVMLIFSRKDLFVKP